MARRAKNVPSDEEKASLRWYAIRKCPIRRQNRRMSAVRDDDCLELATDDAGSAESRKIRRIQ